MENVKPIRLKFENGDEYTLEFDRDTVAYAEDDGFDPADFNTKGYSTTTYFFHLAFRTHHPELTQEDTDKILFDDLGGLTQAMIDRLIALYNKTYKELMNTSGKPKNAKLTVVM